MRRLRARRSGDEPLPDHSRAGTAVGIPQHDAVLLPSCEVDEPLRGLEPPGVVAALDGEAEAGGPPATRFLLESPEQDPAQPPTPEGLLHPEADLRGRLVDEAVARVA